MNCTKCDKQLRVDNTAGVCGDSVACRKRAEGAAGDDQVLERLDVDKPRKATKTPPTTMPVQATEGLDWQRQFFQLAEALGLNPVEMIELHCRSWVETTRARALATTAEVKDFE